MSISWPAAIKCSGDDELLFIKDECAWLTDDLSAYAYSEDDVLVDSNSALFSLVYDAKIKKAVLTAQQKVVSVDQFEMWLKNHMVILNQCCSSKLRLLSINEGLTLLEQFSD